MMETISMMIRTIVILIFLATLLEMLLPQGVFRRYLRLLVGILLILALLSPVKNIMQIAPHWDIPVAGAGEEEGLKKILDRGEAWHRESMDKVLAEYRYNLFHLLDGELARRFGQELTHLEVFMVEDPAKKEFGSLQGIRAVLQKEGGKNAGEIAAPAAQGGGELDTIRIIVEVFPAGEDAKKQVSNNAREPKDDLHLEEAEKITSFLAAFLQLSPDRIHLEILP